MRFLLIVFFSLAPGTLANVIPRQESSECCFSLRYMVGNYHEPVEADSTIVKQTEIGEPRLSDDLPNGSFCLNPETKRLRDENGNQCIFTKHDHQLKCAPDVSDNTEFKFLLGPSIYGQYRYLAYNKQRTFMGCNVEEQSSDDPTESKEMTIFSKAYSKSENCSAYSLIQIEGNDACDASAPDYSKSTVQERCEVMPYSESLAPTRVSSGPKENLQISALGHVVINETSSAIFTFDIDPNFTNHIEAQSRLCALQLRLPYCSSLPAGAACYEWSGRAQQKQYGSGVKVTKVSDTAERDGFFAAEVAQVTQEGIVWTSTFDCVADLSRKARTVAFMVESVEGWSFRFQQAGMGEPGTAQYESGIGAYITACNTMS